MRVAADTGHTLEPEVEGFRGEAGLVQARDDERAEATIDVEGDLVADRETGERRDVVDDAMWVVWRGSDKEYGVAVDEPAYRGYVDLVGGSFGGYEVDLDLEVFAGFQESGVRSVGTDHLGFCDASLIVCFLSGAQTGHENRLGAATGCDTCCSLRRVEKGQNLRSTLAKWYSFKEKRCDLP